MKDGKLVIKTANPALYDFIVTKDNDRQHYKDLKKAIVEITGRDIKIVINTVADKEEKKDDSPLANMISKINEFNSEGD